MIFPLALVGGGLALIAYLLSASDEKEVPVNEPDLPPPPPPLSGQIPTSTRYKRVDAILPALKAASDSSKIPLGVLVGWVARESGGKLAVHPQPGPGDTKYDERGYFQLMPAESQKLGLEHKRLSTDATYSINAGLALIGYYMGEADSLGVAPRGSSYYWKLVKMMHNGSTMTRKIVAAAKLAGKAGSWEDLEQYAVDHNDLFLATTKHSPKKWFGLVDDMYEIGKPFGFGTDATLVVGEAAFTDIPDPMELYFKV